MARSVRIKDQAVEAHLFTTRAMVAAVLMVLAVAAVIARLAWLQIVQYDYFAELSQGNRIRIEPLPPNRGLILDRNGKALATNAPSYQLELVREQVPDLEGTLKRLAELKLIEANDVTPLLKEIKSRRAFEAFPVKLQLTEEELATFAVRRPDFPGVEIRPRLTRFYPLGGSSVHALGYVSAISEEDKKILNIEEYAGTTLAGKSGVERAYEKELHGETGFQQMLVNAQGRRVETLGRGPVELKRKEPVAGNDLYLTIDERVQQTAEEALRDQRASAVAIDPSNGDILAFVSTPGFDPNLFARGLTRKEYLALTEDPDRPMYDRALRGVYPPGSTVKPLMALAALEANVITPHDTRFCRGAWRMPGVSRPWRDWKKEGHGTVDMRKALATSCDVYFYDMANLMGIDRMAAFLSQFGLGGLTGIDIPGEKAGILPSTAWKKKAFKRKELQQWYPGDTISVGIGQGYMTVTPLELAHAITTLAARGQRFKPRLVRAIRNSQTGGVVEIPPVQLPAAKTREPDAWEYAIGGMIDVANAPYGTARAAATGSQYLIAGKSGTAQVFTVAASERMRKANELAEHLRDHALFVAFAPADAPMPKIAVAVVVENAPGGGSAFAAPVVRRILDSYLLTPEEFAAAEAKRAEQEAKKKAAAAGATRTTPPAPPAGRE
ncbi:MAG: penicillin-binding protein 2 [Steroidobacteraceae bacterium]